ncbi:MAG: OmpA family protein [Bacteroidota bacterium]
MRRRLSTHIFRYGAGLLCALLPLLLSAQTFKGDNAAAAREAYDLAAEALMEGQLQRGLRQLRRSIAFDTTFIPAYRVLGQAEALDDNYVDAVNALREVIRRDSNFSRLMYFELGDIYYKMGRPQLALHYMRKFRDLQERPLIEFGLGGEQERADELEVLERLEHRIQAARITMDSAQFINITELHNLGPPINSVFNDYFPFFDNNRLGLLFTRQNERGDEDLLRGRRRSPTASWTVSRAGSINTRTPEGMSTLVRDGERIYFTLCGRDSETEIVGGCDIFRGWYQEDRVQEIESLGPGVNSESWDSQAAISCDGRKLFFASIRPGGQGGSDIWYCELQNDGSWSAPQNLGPGVNTPEDEEAPFLSNDGRTLFFASTGHLNLGDQDIFMSWWDEDEDRWTTAINLGPPINSAHRELGFHLAADGRTGYFASDRPGGLGGLDIFSFTLSEELSGEPITFLSAYVLDSITGMPLADQRVQVGDGSVFRTNMDGRFFICYPANEDIDLGLEVPEYHPYRKRFAVPLWDNTHPYRLDLLLQPVTSPPPPPPPPDTVRRSRRLKAITYSVLFRFDEAILTDLQRENLELFLQRIDPAELQEVSITGYSDDIGESQYNVELSEERARAVGTFLRAKGITTNQVSIRGAGSILGGQRELNRRVELKIKYFEEQ